VRGESESFFTYESPDKGFYSYANCGNAYDPTLEKLLDDVPEELTNICNGDIGCILDGQEIGADAAQDYEADPALKRPKEIPPPPTPAPTPAPQRNPESNSAGSNGDPHCKYFTLRSHRSVNDPPLTFVATDSQNMEERTFRVPRTM